MKRRLLLLLCILVAALSGCAYWVVEEPPVQVGASVYRAE